MKSNGLTAEHIGLAHQGLHPFDKRYYPACKPNPCTNTDAESHILMNNNGRSAKNTRKSHGLTYKHHPFDERYDLYIPRPIRCLLPLVTLRVEPFL